MKTILTIGSHYNKLKIVLLITISFSYTFSNTLLAQSENVGIGLTNPLKRFSVNGSILIDQNNTSNGQLDSAALLFGTTGGGTGIASKKTLGGLRYGLQFYTGNISRINITSGGYVGIGLESPTLPLDVNGSIKSSYNVYAGNDMFVGGLSTIEERLSIGGSGNASYKLYVHNGHSYFQGSGTFTAPLYAQGGLVTNTVSASGYLSASQNAKIDGNLQAGSLNVDNDGIVDGNFRVNGRIGVNGATNSNYGLIVNNANTYLQGNATVTGTTTFQGPVNIMGKGSVRCDGTSSLRIGFSSAYTGHSYGGHDAWFVTVNVADFDLSTSNVRVMIAQFEPTAAYAGDVADFKWYVTNLDADANTCQIRIINESAFIRVLQGTFYLMAVAKD